MARTGPTTLTFPPFEGATRVLILIYLAVFFIEAILGWMLTPSLFFAIFGHLALVPQQLLHGEVWRLATYTFVPMDVLGTLFTMIFLWFIGSILEQTRGSRWLYELFFSAAIGGGLFASIIAFTHVFGLSPAASGYDPYTAIYGLLVAILVLMGETEFRPILFPIVIKAKYMVTIYILIDTARLLLHSDPFNALMHLCGAACGYLFLHFVPRKGLTYGVSEQYYALRNEFYRAKRRNAAKKFEVYMRKQNRDVHFDKDGKYVDPDERDPNDKRWMN